MSKPGSEVTVELHTDEIKPGTLTADAEGYVDADVKTPAAHRKG